MVDLAKLRELLAPSLPNLDPPWTVSAPDAPLSWRIEDGSGGHVADVATLADATMICAIVNAAPELIEAADERDRLRAENARLREALKPFAEAVKAISESPRPIGVTDAISVPIPDSWLRRAAAAIAGDPDGS